MLHTDLIRTDNGSCWASRLSGH